MMEQEWLTSKDPVAMLDWLNTPASLNGKPWSEWRPSDRKLWLFVCAIAIASPSPELSRILRDIIGNPFQPVTLPLGEPCRKCKGKGDIPAGPGGAVVGRKERLPCERCHGTGNGPSPVLTPLVLSLAQAAYTVRTGTGTLDNDVLAVLSDALEEAGLPERVAFLTCDDAGKHRHSGRAGEVIHGVLHDCIPWVAHHHHDEKCQILSKPNPILAHLREPGPHYRGCWAVDLLLGKE